MVDIKRLEKLIAEWNRRANMIDSSKIINEYDKGYMDGRKDVIKFVILELESLLK